MEINTLEELIQYSKNNGRVCPQPQLWNELWNKLKDKKQNDKGWVPPLPLILAAWHNSSDSSKQLRLVEHLKYAESKGQIKEISEFLRSLKEEDWYHIKH